MMVVTFFYCVVWMLIVAGFSGILFYHIQAKLVCDEFDGKRDMGVDDPSNCFHYADKGTGSSTSNHRAIYTVEPPNKGHTGTMKISFIQVSLFGG